MKRQWVKQAPAIFPCNFAAATILSHTHTILQLRSLDLELSSQSLIGMLLACRSLLLQNTSPDILSLSVSFSVFVSLSPTPQGIHIACLLNKICCVTSCIWSGFLGAFSLRVCWQALVSDWITGSDFPRPRDNSQQKPSDIGWCSVTRWTLPSFSLNLWCPKLMLKPQPQCDISRAYWRS